MASSTDIFLKWNGHHDALVPMLYSQLEKKKFVDVTIKVEGKNIGAHCLILCAASEYFEELFKQNHELAVVTLQNMKFCDVQSIIEYIYKGEVSLSREQLGSFFTTATSLKVKGLAEKENNHDQAQESVEVVEMTTTPNLVPGSNIRPTQAQVIAEESANDYQDHQMMLELGENLDHQVPHEQRDPDVVIVDQPPRPPPVVVNLDESMIEEEQGIDLVSNSSGDQDSSNSDSSSDNEENDQDANGSCPTDSGYFNCGDCGRDFKLKFLFQRHKLKGDCQSVPYFRCALCRMSFIYRPYLRQHLSRYHTNVKSSEFDANIIYVKPSYACNLCSHRSDDRVSFRRHKKKHNVKTD